MQKHYVSTAYADRTLRVKIAKGKVWQIKKAVNAISQLSMIFTTGSKHAGETVACTELLSTAMTRQTFMCEQGLRT